MDNAISSATRFLQYVGLRCPPKNNFIAVNSRIDRHLFEAYISSLWCILSLQMLVVPPSLTLTLPGYLVYLFDKNVTYEEIARNSRVVSVTQRQTFLATAASYAIVFFYPKLRTEGHVRFNQASVLGLLSYTAWRWDILTKARRRMEALWDFLTSSIQLDRNNSHKLGDGNRSSHWRSQDQDELRRKRLERLDQR